MIWGGDDIIIEIKCTNKCNVLESSENYLPPPWSMKNCLLWDQSLVPKRLGTAALGNWIHNKERVRWHLSHLQASHPRGVINQPSPWNITSPNDGLCTAWVTLKIVAPPSKFNSVGSDTHILGELCSTSFCQWNCLYVKIAYDVQQAS